MAASERAASGTGSVVLRTVLLDAGGTLIYMPRGAEEILRELCEQLGVSITLEQSRLACRQSERFYADNYLGYAGDQEEFWLRFHGEALRSLGIADPSREKARFLSRAFGRAEVWQAYPEVAGVCERLLAMGLRLGVVSNGPTTVLDMLSQAGLRRYFEVVVTSQAAGIEKPDPRIFGVALDTMGVSAREALFVGDIYEIDVLGARAAGLMGVLIDRGGASSERDCPVIRTLQGLIPLLRAEC